MSLYPTSPTVKLEPSTASASSPMDETIEDALCSSNSVTSENTQAMDSTDNMTPDPWAEDDQDSSPSPVPYQTESTPAASGEKKPTKKRKSWGQVLPEPKTNLPPRKRAKTEDEKEQRRVERVLRNRRAAQSSRERKRLEVEALEQRNKELESLVVAMKESNALLAEELSRLRRSSVSNCASPRDPLRDTLSQQLFSSSNGYQPVNDVGLLMDNMIMPKPTPTVNPASISPELAPALTCTVHSPAVPHAEFGDALGASSSDMTQHPAEMLPWDLPCHTPEDSPLFLETMPKSPTVRTCQIWLSVISISMIASTCQRPLVQIALSLKAGFSLLPTPQLLTTIIWLTTACPPHLRKRHWSSSTSTNSLMTKQITPLLAFFQRATRPLPTMASTHSPLTLRYRLLRKILASSPDLARPLLDATMVALRMGSTTACDAQLGTWRTESMSTRGQVAQLVQCLKRVKMPSQGVLLTLAWVLKVEERKRQRKHRMSHRGMLAYQPSVNLCIRRKKS